MRRAPGEAAGWLMLDSTVRCGVLARAGSPNGLAGVVPGNWADTTAAASATHASITCCMIEQRT